MVHNRSYRTPETQVVDNTTDNINDEDELLVEALLSLGASINSCISSK